MGSKKWWEGGRERGRERRHLRTIERHVLEAVKCHAQQQRGEEDDIVPGPLLRARGIDKGSAKDTNTHERGREGRRKERAAYLARHVLEPIERHAQQQRGEEDDIVPGPLLRVRGVYKGGAKDEDEGEEVHDVGVGEGDPQVHHLNAEGGIKGGRGVRGVIPNRLGRLFVS